MLRLSRTRRSVSSDRGESQRCVFLYDISGVVASAAAVSFELEGTPPPPPRRSHIQLSNKQTASSPSTSKYSVLCSASVI